jgi:hypothetical protein
MRIQMGREFRWLEPGHDTLKHLAFDGEGKVMAAQEKTPSVIVYNWPLLMPDYLKYVGSKASQNAIFVGREQGVGGDAQSAGTEGMGNVQQAKVPDRLFNLVPPNLRKKHAGRLIREMQINKKAAGQ